MLTNKRVTETNAKKRSQLFSLQRRYQDLIQELRAARLQKSFGSPEVNNAVRVLRGATDSLNQCAATTRGDDCTTSGMINLDLIFEAITGGDSNRSIRASVRGIQEKMNSRRAEWFRN